MTEENNTDAEKAVRALGDFLRNFFVRNRIPWMHDSLGTEFDQGEAHALIGLVLIPELRAALDGVDEQIGRDLEKWHETFKPKENQ
jgi:hypothetical protein